MTPDDMRAQVREIVTELAKAPQAMEQYELQYELAELEAERAYDLAFIEADGNVEERKAQARLSSSELREQAAIAKAAHTRVKTKTRQLEYALVAGQALLKSIQIEGA